MARETAETALIVLPLPPRVLSPNCMVGSRGGRMMKAAATKRYRAQAADSCRAAGIETGPWQRATVAAAFFYAQRRRRDQDNAMASLKAAYDGLVDAGLVVDDDFEHLERLAPTFALDAACPRVELRITRLA